MKLFSFIKKCFLAGLVISISSCKPVGQIFDDFMPPTNPSISINSGASLTNSIAVTLTLNATEAHQMYITNTSGCSAGGAYEPYTSSKAWLLDQSNGVATVYAKFRDRRGNETSCLSASISHDSASPTVSSVSSTTSNGSYKAGDVISIQVNFSEAVTVVGTPTLTLETGATDRSVNYSSGSGSSTLTFNYTVQTGDINSDLDYVATTSLALNSGTIQDAAGNNATLSLPTPGAANSLGANKALVVDAVSPTVSSVNSLSNNGSYKAGDAISIQVNFSEAVTVNTTNGTPTLTLETGATDRAVSYASGSGTSSLTFTYTVQAGDTSSDLDYVATTSLALNSGTIKDTVGNNATLTLPAPGAANSLGANKALVVDTTSPTVASVNSSTANGSYKAGDAISIQVNFSESVVVDTTNGTPTLTLETGATDRAVNYASGSGTSSLTFTYTVQSGDTSSDLDYVATTSLALNGGTIKDAALNNATLTLPAPGAANSLGANKALVIDGITPSVASVNSSTADGSYKAGDAISIQVNFSESVVVDTTNGTPTLTLETGATDRAVNYASGSGTSSLTFTYTVQAGDTSSDLDYVATTSLALNTGTIKDSAGNDATLTLPAPGAANSLGANKALVVDTTAPTVASVNSSTADGTYGIGAVISIQANFSEAVSVDTTNGTPTLTLETGTTDRNANYTSGSGTTSLTFTYTIQAGDSSNDLDYVATTSLALNSATIKDAVGNNATLTLPAPGAANSLGANRAIVVDPVPVVTQVTSSTSNGTYGVGETLTIQVVFSEAVAVDTSLGTPALTLTTGSGTTAVNYASGTGTTTLSFNYSVGEGHYFSDLDYAATTSLALNSGTIKSSTNASQNAILTLASPGAANSLAANKDLRSLLYASKAWTVTDDTFGKVLAKGDINGDSYADVIVGIPAHNGGDGRIVVYSGNPSSAFGSVVLMDILGAANQAESFGNSVAAADVNNDGKAEVIVGIPLFDLPPVGTDHGKVSVYAFDVNNASPAPLYSINGVNADDNFGASVAWVGDLDADGKEEFLVGAIGVDGTGTSRGRVYIRSGADGSSLGTVSGDEDNAFFGASVAGTGDINNDGKPDFMVSAPIAAAGGISRGKVRVYSGADSTILYTYNGSADNDQWGYSLAGNADVNGDGRPDFMIGSSEVDPTVGAADRGQVIVYSGIDGTVIYTLSGAANSDNFGQSIDFVGDADNDGKKDFIIGATGVTVNGTVKGQATVYKGSDGTVLYTINGSETDEKFGYGVLGLRSSFENDSRDDFVVSAPFANGAGSDRGKIQVYR